MIMTVCYNEYRDWTSREQAIAYFSEGVAMSEGSERERYENILNQLRSGLMYCKDE